MFESPHFENTDKELDNKTGNQVENEPETIDAEWKAIAESIETEKPTKLYERFKKLIANPRTYAILTALSISGQAEAQDINILPENATETQVSLSPESWEDKKYQIMCDAIDQVVLLEPQYASLSDSLIEGQTTTAISRRADRVIGDYLVQTDSVLIGEFEKTFETKGNTQSTHMEGRGQPHIEVNYFINLETSNVERVQVNLINPYGGCFLLELDDEAQPINPERLTPSEETPSSQETPHNDRVGHDPLSPGIATSGDF